MHLSTCIVCSAMLGVSIGISHRAPSAPSYHPTNLPSSSMTYHNVSVAVAAARLAKDTTVDSNSAALMTKDGSETVGTKALAGMQVSLNNGCVWTSNSLPRPTKQSSRAPSSAWYLPHQSLAVARNPARTPILVMVLSLSLNKVRPSPRHPWLEMMFALVLPVSPSALHVEVSTTMKAAQTVAVSS